MAKNDKKAKASAHDKAADNLLSRFKYDFLADFRNEEKWRTESKKSGDYYDGIQWTEDEKAKLADRGQPDVTINRIKPRLDAVFGIQQALRVDTKAYPVHDKENEALMVSEKLREVEDANDFDEKESQAFKDCIIDGRGWYEIGKRWDGLKSRHAIKRGYGEDIVIDRHCREDDLTDAKRVSKSVMTELEDAIALYPDYAEKLEMTLDDKLAEVTGNHSRENRPDNYQSTKWGFGPDDYNDFVDRDRKRIRLVTTYYRTQTPERYFFHAELKEPTNVTEMDDKSIETLKATHPGGEIVTQWRKSLNSITFSWNCILEQLTDLREHDDEAKYPFVLVPGYKERATKRHYGLVRQMMDAQDEVNKRRSKLLHLLNVNRVRFEDGAFDDEEKARREFVKPDGWIKQRKDFEVVVDNNLDISMAHFQLLQQSTQEIDNAAAGREVEGRSQASSGREFQLRQQTVVQPIRELFSNLRAARRRVALYLLDEILKENPDLQANKYDIVVEEAPESLNLNAETFEQLVSLANNSKVPVPMDMLIKVAPLPGPVKTEFMDRLKAQEQQQAQQAQQAQQMQMAQIQMEMQMKQAELGIKQQDSQVKAMQADTERKQAIVDSASEERGEK